MRALLTVAILTLAAALGAAPPAEKPPHGQGKYLVMLWDAGTPVPGKPDQRMKKVPEPEAEKLGGRLLAKQANRRVMFLPYAAAKQLRKHQAVAYVQRIWMGEPPSEWNEADAATTSPRAAQVESHADPAFTWDREYTYDADGNIERIGADQFAYDDLGRLTAAIVDGSTQGYTYDDFGNLTSTSRPGSTAVSVPADPMTNRMIGETYDAAGNVTSRKARGTYVYDALNMIVEMGMTPGISRRRILYDANDERIGTLIDAMLQRWTIRDFDGQVLREFTGYDNGLNLVWSWEQDHVRGEGQLIAGETVTWQYNADEDPEAFQYGGKRHYHLDHLGSVRVVTNQAGKALSEHDFYPFGAPRTKQHQEQLVWGQPHEDAMRFAGHWRDFLGPQEVEDDEYLDFMHARYYDPNLGRFLSVDPIVDIKGNLQNPQGWNRYAYVRNNPLRFTDPTGKYTCSGSAEQCKAVEENIDRLRQAAAILRERRAPGASALTRAVAFYGKKGERNGVAVSIANLQGAAAAVAEKRGNKVIVSIDADTLMNSRTPRGPAVEMAGAFAHESEHGIRYQSGDGPWNIRADVKNSEREAYRWGGYVSSAFGVNSAYQVWENGLWNLPKLEEWAEKSTVADCASMGGCQ